MEWCSQLLQSVANRATLFSFFDKIFFLELFENWVIFSAKKKSVAFMTNTLHVLIHKTMKYILYLSVVLILLSLPQRRYFNINFNIVNRKSLKEN